MMKISAVCLVMALAVTACQHTESTSRKSQNEPSVKAVQKDLPEKKVSVMKKNPPPEPVRIMVAEKVKQASAEPEIKIPSDPVEKAALYIKAGYGKSAAKILRGIKPRPETYQYFQLLAESCYLSRDYSCASREAQKAFKLADTDIKKYNSLIIAGRAYKEKRHFRKALTVLNSGCKLIKENVDCRISRVQIYILLKSKDVLEKELKVCISDFPARGEFQLFQGDLLILQRKIDSAVSHLKKVSENTSFAKWVRARALDSMGKLLGDRSRADAAKVLEKCKKLFPAYGCVETELSISPPDPRHPGRKIRDVKRKPGGGY
ncbi:MAG: tetratricopeptide repeat protein [Deltaproteobacteria bacterium]|nr:tetratricopeptide repeat protein [Deltaproteobacteria bacterium]